MRGATIDNYCKNPYKLISTHAPLAGRDASVTRDAARWSDFNPRAPCGARLNTKHLSTPQLIFQPTRPLRGATLRPPALINLIIRISTHAPLAGRDSSPDGSSGRQEDFNPRAPCGARQKWEILRRSCIPFQPTRPLRGATLIWRYLTPKALKFQPTRPLRGATNRVFNPCNSSNISTHAPLAGRDRGIVRGILTCVYFNPRAPCGARPRPMMTIKIIKNFNPRAPCGARLQREKAIADR